MWEVWVCSHRRILLLKATPQATRVYQWREVPGQRIGLCARQRKPAHELRLGECAHVARSLCAVSEGSFSVERANCINSINSIINSIRQPPRHQIPRPGAGRNQPRLGRRSRLGTRPCDDRLPCPGACVTHAWHLPRPPSPPRSHPAHTPRSPARARWSSQDWLARQVAAVESLPEHLCPDSPFPLPRPASPATPPTPTTPPPAGKRSSSFQRLRRLTATKLRSAPSRHSPDCQ